jgi:hypothetical protein
MRWFYICDSIRRIQFSGLASAGSGLRGRPGIALAVMSMLLAVPTLASALSIQIDYTASVTTFIDPNGLMPGAQNGDPMTGSIRIDLSSAIDLNPAAGIGDFAADGGTFEADLPLFVSVLGTSNSASTNAGIPRLVINGNLQFTQAVPFSTIYDALLELEGFDTPADELFLFTDADVHRIESYTDGSIELTTASDPGFLLLAEISSIQVSEVPEPSSALLIGIGLAGLAAMKRSG